MEQKFKLGKKWFWIGIVLGFSPVFGIIYGLSLLLERNYRKEGLIIILWAIAWFVLSSVLITPWLRAQGLLPSQDCLRGCWIQARMKMPAVGDILTP
ncbi:MAG: hypothetical protein WC297_01715 [Candidatus Paceibacterota bacterium]|jgi:hypothetical protein